MEYPIWPFWSQTGHGFCALVLNLVCAVFLKEASFSSLAIRPGNQTIHVVDKAGDPGSSNFMIYGRKAGLRSGINLRDRP